ncbi:hypothetical protein BV25DRAFT_91939 [Artomyces pyxidatus]|uniref:Uncharacterized protein n=1 Tax=Artomyces pyxidatus TaxID=48021 RepID=A0ACB8TKU5_9AGAM|nr:hypothetical protein BV25DRAFT_91939 [Artomyces pyxidatus]
MSTPVTPSLIEWVQSHLNDIYTAPTEDAFHAAVGAYLSPNAEIYVNEQKMTRAEKEDRILAQWHAANRVSVKWENAIEVPKDEGLGGFPTGLVGGFYVVTHTMKIRIRAGPMQYYTAVAIQARIEQDPSIQPDEHGDRRRVVYLYETEADKRAPTFIHPVPPKAEAEQMQ